MFWEYGPCFQFHQYGSPVVGSCYRVLVCYSPVFLFRVFFSECFVSFNKDKEVIITLIQTPAASTILA